MILLWGEFDDPPFASVVTEVRKMGHPAVIVNDEALLGAVFRPVGHGSLDGKICFDEITVTLRSLTSGYLRPSDAPPVTSACEHCIEALRAWADISSARIINRPSAMAANNSKPHQAQLIRAAGFSTPDTIVTTDPKAVREFQRRHGQLIYKSISGVRSIISRFNSNHETYLEDVTNCPTMFQRYVEGVDYRVHVVGDELFPCRIVSTADDYRYPKTKVERPVIEAANIDADVAVRIRDMVWRMGLLLAGVDLRRAVDGDWYCFEVNPSPAFTYFTQSTGQRIELAIARLLASGTGA